MWAYTKTSLVLGGGGIRWCAHVGVYRRMCELWIQPDEIIGTSIGAIVGAFIAFGLSADDMENIIKSIPTTILLSPDLKTGLLSQKGMIKYFSKFLGTSARIEDTRIPLKIIVTNFDTGEKEVLTSWPLLPAIAASAAIPSLFAPVPIDKYRYIDGGIVDNLAVSEASYEHIIAVSVIWGAMSKKQKRKDTSIFWIHLFTPYHAYADLIQAFKIMLMQNELAKFGNKREKIILIKPDVDGVNLLQINKALYTMRQGYIAGKESL